MNYRTNELTGTGPVVKESLRKSEWLDKGWLLPRTHARRVDGAEAKQRTAIQPLTSRLSKGGLDFTSQRCRILQRTPTRPQKGFAESRELREREVCATESARGW